MAPPTSPSQIGPPANADASPPAAPVARIDAMPAPAPLAMPAQMFDVAPAPDAPGGGARLTGRALALRLFVVGVTAALTAYGVREMYLTVAVGTVTYLQWALIALFSLNFSWIAFAFGASIVGFFVALRRVPPPPRPASLATRTAIAMPIYNEAPARVFGAVAAMREEVEATGLGAAFDWFWLSDTTDPDVFVAEEAAFLKLRAALGPDARLFYRHRPKNARRKAGNLEDFVSRHGAAYDHLLVLDADSLMSGAAIVALAGAMEADPKLGILQSPPLIVNRNTLFARVQQFAARVTGPVVAGGLAAWSGDDGNYWGHNAIIRMRAFAAHCGLPDLPGGPPFGGLVMSHDFVEAALIRRAGYAVRMAPATLGGSYEESPPTPLDLAQRDRRWAQGNLQHARVIGARGFALASRQHFATGIFGYVASPFWLLQLLLGMALALQSRFVRPEYFASDFALFPTWPRFDAARALSLFEVTMAVLLAPKLFGLLAALADAPTRRGCGGALALIGSTLVEIVASALLAPMMMLVQTGSVAGILLGRDAGWSAQ
ncbi:MAG: glucans biosynthesis glucosyltransferase MdoH, partial [Hyphomicrobiales bacterium]|nr:glucans biosynthesis glucosyltransferase MdoH [Hyphomicrobiales bacterium]